MIIEREKFLGVLNAIRPGVARKEIVEEHAHFVFTGRRAVTYNEQICVSIPFKTEFACSVQADEFLKLIKSLNAEELELGMVEEEGKNALTITANRVESQFVVSINERGEALIKELKINSLAKLWKPVPEDFQQAIQWCLFSASKDATQQYLTCLHVKKKMVVSSDDLRISSFTMDSAMDANILLPATSVEELAKFTVTDFCVIDPWAYFKTSAGAVFCIHLVGGDYPNPKQMFEFEGADIELPGELTDALESAEIMATGDFDTDKRIRLSIEKGMLTVFAENSALGWIKNKMKMGVRNTPSVSFVINPIFLRQILTKTSTVKVGEDRALFQTENFQHLVSLHSGE